MNVRPPRHWALLIGQIVVLLLLAACVGDTHGTQPPEPGDLAVVIYNSRMPESKTVADYYALRRGVPTGQLVGLALPMTEEITRAEFKTLLQEPLFDWLVAKGLFSLGSASPDSSVSNRTARVVGSRVRYAVLCYGVPLKIQPDAALRELGATGLRPELQRNEAAVDSELVCLPMLRQNTLLTGLITNAFYGTAVASILQPTNGVLLVGRLDGPTAEIARGLVDKALQAERDGLWGRAYIDARGIKEGSLQIGENILHGAAQACSKMGYDVVVDVAPATFAPEFPLSHVAVYAGWYEENVNGPFAQPEVEFMPGAFAYHLHSLSAATLRSTTAHWAGPLLAKGATITLGSVYEPYLSGTSDVSTLLRDLLLLGFSFGEAAWSAEFGFSWQTTVVGDPLYRPYSLPLPERHQQLEKARSSLIEWSHAMLADRELQQGRSLETVSGQLKRLPLTEKSAVLAEKLADILGLKGNATAAAEAYSNALRLRLSKQQKVRLYLALAGFQRKLGRDNEAVGTLKLFLADCPEYPAKKAVWEELQKLARRLGDTQLAAECMNQLKP